MREQGRARVPEPIRSSEPMARAIEDRPGSPSPRHDEPQRVLGNQRVQRLLAPEPSEAPDPPMVLQTRLAIGPPGDVFEREADRVAELVVDTPGINGPGIDGLGIDTVGADTMGLDAGLSGLESPTVAPSAVLQRQEIGGGGGGGDAADEEDDAAIGAFAAIVRRKENGGSAADAPTDIEARISAARGRGRQLPTSARRRMESGFGLDFRPVRIHTNSEADRLSRGLGALAFTVGRDIFFATGQFRPGQNDGDRLLAHELTHVVQQTGAAPARPVRQMRRAEPRIQRTGSSYESKGYYRRRVSGIFVHHEVERRLVANDSDLVVEAPIPGANRFAPGHVRVGFADLYKSTPTHAMAGVRGILEGQSVDHFKNMPGPDTRTLSGTRPRSPAQFGPRMGRRPRGGGLRPWSGDFPSRIEVADIKPVSTERIAGGMMQIDSYRTGFRDFVGRAHGLNGGVTRSRQSFSTGELSSVRIPHALNYRRFTTEAQRATPGPGSLVVGNARYWIDLLDPGIYVYFDLPARFDTRTYARFIRDRKAELDRLLGDLRRPRRTPTGPGLTRDPKAATRPMPESRSPSSERPIAERPIAERPIAECSPREPRTGEQSTREQATGERPSGGPSEREARPTPPPALEARPGPRAEERIQRTVNWRAEGNRWEASRGPWARTIRSFLRRQGRALERKAEIDQRLDVGDRTSTPATVRREIRAFESILRWSSGLGRVLGRLRFRFGALFERIDRVLERMKERLRGVRGRIRAAAPGGISIGWQRTLIRVILRGAKLGAERLVAESARIFIECFNALGQKVLEEFTENASEELRDNLRELRSRFEDLRRQLRDRIESLVGNFDELVTQLSDAQRWISLATSLVQLIRAGVQVVSCLSPPALGCLWGLAAQIGLDVALDLLVGTEWFEENIVNPSIRDLLRRYAGRHYQALIDGALERAGLTSYAGGVTACQVAPESQDRFLSRRFVSGGISGDAALRRHRDAWQARHSSEIDAAIRRLFTNSEGEPPTPRQIQDFLDHIDGMSPDEIRRLIERGRRAGSEGRINLDIAGTLAEDERLSEDHETATRETRSTPDSVREEGGGGPETEAEQETEREGEASIPTLDARQARGGSRTGSPSAELGAQVMARSGHTAHPDNPPIEVTVLIYEVDSLDVVLQVRHVPVRVVRRTWHPEGTTRDSATDLVVHYELLEPISLAPHFPNRSLTGDQDRLIRGILRWRR